MQHDCTLPRPARRGRWPASRRTVLTTLGAALAAGMLPGGSALSDDDADTILVGVNPTFPPFEMERDGQTVGFDMDIIAGMAAASGLAVKVRTMPFSGIIPSLQAGSIDVAASGITITRERLKNVHFSDPYYRSGLSVLVKAGSGIDGFDDLGKRVVATQKATSSVEYLANHGISGNQVKQFQSINGAYQALMTGGADAVLFDNPVNVMFKAGHPQVEIVGELLTGEYYGIAISRKRPELVDKLNAGLRKMQQDGSYEALFQRWFDGDLSGAVQDELQPDAVAIGD